MPKLLDVARVVTVVALCASCGEIQSATYATYADAIAHGAQQRGWLPPFVPVTATDIQEVHDIDTNYQWLRFRVPVGDTSVGIGAVRIPIEEAAIRANRPPRVMGDWLPELRNAPTIRVPGPELRKPPIITRRSAIQAYRHLRLFHPAARCVAVLPADGWAYAWTC